MFLAHFVGDVHQPMHCGRIADLGGNTVVVSWYTNKTNLHKVPSTYNFFFLNGPSTYNSS
jgi:hypothetical protein